VVATVAALETIEVPPVELTDMPDEFVVPFEDVLRENKEAPFVVVPLRFAALEMVEALSPRNVPVPSPGFRPFDSNALVFSVVF